MPVSQNPVFPKKLQRLWFNHEAATPGPKSDRRDSIFSKSHDLSEDRGLHQIKTSPDSRSLFHFCALL
jgi:hypothetical protein